MPPRSNPKKRPSSPPSPSSAKKLKSTPSKRGVEKSSRVGKSKPKKSTAKKEEEEDEEDEDSDVPGGGARNKDGEEFWEISDMRRVSIATWSGQRLVTIREYYENKKDGELLPGKKGISLTVDQFNALVSFVPHIQKVLVHKYGVKGLTRPSYEPREDDIDAGTSKGSWPKDAEKEEEQEQEEKQDGGVNDDEVEVEFGVHTGGRKKNFEATSDEE